jgi:hypothetical protein
VKQPFVPIKGKKQTHNSMLNNETEKKILIKKMLLEKIDMVQPI